MNLFRSLGAVGKITIVLYIAVVAVGIFLLALANWGGAVLIGLGVFGVAMRLLNERFRQRLIREAQAERESRG